MEKDFEASNYEITRVENVEWDIINRFLVNEAQILALLKAWVSNVEMDVKRKIVRSVF